MVEIDPALLDEVLTANEDLLRSTILHAHYVERIKNRLGLESVAFLNDQVFPDVLAQAVKAFERLSARRGDVGLYTSARYLALLEELRQTISEGTRQLEGEVTRRLFDQSKLEAAFGAKQLTEASPLTLSFTLPDPEYLQQVVESKPFQGKVLGDWFEGLTQNTQARVTQQVNLGLVQGETIDQLVARLRGTKKKSYSDGAFQASRTEAEAIARTAANHVSNATRQALYAENADIVDKVMWVATLDTRTCPICGKLDGKTFSVDGSGRQPPGPPAHFACRCSLIPVLKSYRELGFDFNTTSPKERASMNGVEPGTLDYEEWIKTQGANAQDEALGPVRAGLLRSGDLEVKQFTDDRGNLLTLEDLAKKYGVELPAQYR